MITPLVSLDCLSGAAGFLAKNWGDYGYRIGIESSNWDSAIFLVRCMDGSEFRIQSDRYGNATEYPVPEKEGN